MSNHGRITGKLGFIRDIGIMVWFTAIAVSSGCGSDGSDKDAGACPAGQVLRYESAGCGAAAKPVCGSPQQDACFRAVCSCNGVTISRCDYANEPFASFGACADSAADGPRDQAQDTPTDVPADAPVDHAVDLAPVDLAVDGGIDGGLAPLDAGIDSTLDLGSVDGGGTGFDGSYDAGACPAGQVLRYETPGCGVEAKPVCGSGQQDACFRAVCSCKGVTISRCDYASEPFASFGSCDANGPG